MTGKRSIFEDVNDTSRRKAAPATGGLIDGAASTARRAIRLWMGVLFAMVVLMIAVGGLTRLTDSGLSITEWRPVSGVLPPMNAEDWQTEFDSYREIPQYQLLNRGMTLEDFKTIYWWEWAHRQLGRAVGLVWALGFLGFLAARRIPSGWTGRMLVPGVLGGVQGAIGWWMVHSGLQEGMIAVASYRLAVHLGLAFVILGLLAWYIFLLGRSETDLLQARRMKERRLFSVSTGLMHFAFLQILLGALVAGLDAGRNYTDWPLMAGGFLPPQPFDIEPWWRNFFENDGLVQFIHRKAGYLLAAFSVVVWLRARRSPHPATRLAFNAMLVMMALQIVLGVVTVMHSAPLYLALTHQLGAVLLWVFILRGRHLAGYPRVQSVRG